MHIFLFIFLNIPELARVLQLMSFYCHGLCSSCNIVVVALTRLFCLIFFFTYAQKLSGEGNGTLLQYSCLENAMDRGAWWAAVHGVAKSQTRLSNFTFPFHFHALEKAMATHSSVLAWRIPGTGDPGGLLSMGSHRVRHDWSNLAAAAAAAAKVIYDKICPNKSERALFHSKW